MFYSVLHYRELTESRPVQPLDAVAGLRCPTLVLCGQRDALVAPEHLDRLEALLRRHGVPHEFQRYPDAEHGFFNEMLKTHHPAAAGDAWARTLEFLGRRLRG